MEETRRLVRPLGHPLLGRFTVPGDKSLSHRALIMAAMAQGESRLSHLLDSWDVRCTAAIVRQLGADLSGPWEDTRLVGWGRRGPRGGSAERPLCLDCGNSGTTIRLLSGMLAAAGFPGKAEGADFEFSEGGAQCFILDGDGSLRRRPMARIIASLRAMGAHIDSAADSGLAPLRIQARALKGADVTMIVPSAQVKSCLLLAGSKAQGRTIVRGDRGSRDHTERMLRAIGVPLESDGLTVSIDGPIVWDGFSFRVPGDISTASFLLALALALPGSAVTIAEVGLNPTRLGFCQLLRRMGARVEWRLEGCSLGEPWGEMRAEYCPLHGIAVGPDEVPGSIDELVILAVLAATAQGLTEVRGAGELRVKESDRIHATVTQLARLGVRIEELEDGFRILGPTRWLSATVNSGGDHRLAMSLAVAGLLGDDCARETIIEGAQWCAVSFPGFWSLLAQIKR